MLLSCGERFPRGKLGGITEEALPSFRAGEFYFL